MGRVWGQIFTFEFEPLLNICALSEMDLMICKLIPRFSWYRILRPRLPEEVQEFFPAKPGLLYDRHQRAAREFLALGDDYQSLVAGFILPV